MDKPLVRGTVPSGNLSQSILQTLASFFLVQCLVFLLFFRFQPFPAGFLAVFFTAQTVFYLAVFIFLMKNRRLFYNTQNGAAETRVNSANKVTIFRITMLPFLVSLTLVSQRYSGGPAGLALTAAFTLTFASDFVDGRLARKRNQLTYIGKILDSASDYLLLGTIAGAFAYFKLLKTWLFLLIIIRLLFNTLVMFVLFLVRRELVPRTTPIGKAAIAAIMILLVLETAKNLLFPHWISYIEPAAALVIGVSMIDKGVFLAVHIRKPRETIPGLKNAMVEWADQSTVPGR